VAQLVSRHAAIAILAVAASLIACAAPGANAPSSSGGVPTTGGGGSAPVATTAGATTPGATIAGGGGAGTAMVDLTFTGTYAFTAKGTAGRCILGTAADGTKRFGFEGTEADYPGMGKSYSMAEFSGLVDVKWVKDDAVSYGNNGTDPITLTPDHHGIFIDQDLAPFTPQGGVEAGPEHVKGTITCP
jgi:hypothetical protein